MMPIREFESWFAQQLVPWRRVLWMTAILALFVPTALVLGLHEAVGVALPFAFEIVVLGLTFAIWASGLLMLTSWLHQAARGRIIAAVPMQPQEHLIVLVLFIDH